MQPDIHKYFPIHFCCFGIPGIEITWKWKFLPLSFYWNSEKRKDKLRGVKK